MLSIHKTHHLARALNTSVRELSKVLDTAESYYQELLLVDPAKPHKRRIVIDVRGNLRRCQMRLYRRVLLPKLIPTIHSHGGVRGRSIRTNVEPHLHSRFVFKTDISDFYPSVHYKRVYRLFVGALGCSPDVARLCTRLCTYRHHLALGLITSPILADQVLQRVDRRIGAACAKAGLVYTRYVDDMTISGPFDLEQSGFSQLVEGILRDDGFAANPAKRLFGRLEDGTAITNLRIVRGHLDVRREYAEELQRQLDDAARLARGEEPQGRYYTPTQILGRVRFVCWVNPRRRERLMRKYRSIRWELVKERAEELGLQVKTKKLVPLSDASRRSETT